MPRYAPPIERLIKELARLPGIGEKTAARLADFILHQSPEDARRLADSILDVKEKIRLCNICFNLADGELCTICRDPSRDREVVCVVENPDCLIAIEEAGSYRGVYHVLHGVLSPLDGVGPENIRLRELLDRLRNHPVKEVIVATNPSVQGEATALLISRTIQGTGISVSRIATGVPVGGDLRYTDRMTLGKALEFRRSF